jgi:hypothetical protein
MFPNLENIKKIVDERLAPVFKIKEVAPVFKYHGLVDGVKVGEFDVKSDCAKIYKRVGTSITNEVEISENIRYRDYMFRLSVIAILEDLERMFNFVIPTLKLSNIAICISVGKLDAHQVTNDIYLVTLCYV